MKLFVKESVLYHLVFLCVSGKVFMPKETEKPRMHDDDEAETEWDEALALATEEELVDLAGACVQSIRIFL